MFLYASSYGAAGGLLVGLQGASSWCAFGCWTRWPIVVISYVVRLHLSVTFPAWRQSWQLELHPIQGLHVVVMAFVTSFLHPRQMTSHCGLCSRSQGRLIQNPSNMLARTSREVDVHRSHFLILVRKVMKGVSQAGGKEGGMRQHQLDSKNRALKGHRAVKIVLILHF